MTAFDSKLNAAQTICNFMGEIAIRYSAAEMSGLWAAMDVMRKRYGDVFVAAAINKDRKDAELALFRYVKTLRKEREEEIPEVIEYDPPQIWHRAEPRKKRGLLMKIATILAACVIVLTIVACAMSAAAVNRGDSLIAYVDSYMAAHSRR